MRVPASGLGAWGLGFGKRVGPMWRGQRDQELGRGWANMIGNLCIFAGS